ncbi:type III pantothenate kinase [Glaciecola sp.]|nr:type III pantothenate kinase [Glaciecola sp.]
MSEQDKSILFIDVGNSLAKYCCMPATEIQNTELCDINPSLEYFSETLTPVQLLPRVSHIYLSYVKAPEWLAALHQEAAQQNIPIVTATSAKHTRINHSILINGYNNVTNMGVDRWLAMIAAVGLFPQKSDFVVVDAGTAITCDVIFRHQHQGGWIAPGLKTLKTSLLSNTEQVFTNDKAQTQHAEPIILGTDTPDCVEQGCLAQLNGMVNLACETLNDQTDDFIVLITGGDQIKLSFPRKNNIHYVANLVLIGLIQLAKTGLIVEKNNETSINSI